MIPRSWTPSTDTHVACAHNSYRHSAGEWHSRKHFWSCSLKKHPVPTAVHTWEGILLVGKFCSQFVSLLITMCHDTLLEADCRLRYLCRASLFSRADSGIHKSFQLFQDYAAEEGHLIKIKKTLGSIYLLERIFNNAGNKSIQKLDS